MAHLCCTVIISLFALLDGISSQKSDAYKGKIFKQRQALDEFCQCVPVFQCSPDGFIITNGAGLVDFKSGIEGTGCPPDEKCCKLPKDDFDSSEKDVTESFKPTTSYEQVGVAEELNNPSQTLQCGQHYTAPTQFKIGVDPDEGATEYKQFPWMLNMKHVGNALSSLKICGATLIAANAAVTSAHCIVGRNLDTIVVSAGDWDLVGDVEDIPVQERRIARHTVHAKFSFRPKQFDIAIMFFDPPFTLNAAVNPICLPDHSSIQDWDECMALGWGNEPEFDEMLLKKVKLPLISNEECQNQVRSKYRTYRLHRTFLCTGVKPGSDTCLGDGGGPLICSKRGLNEEVQYLVGITSFGIDLGQYECGHNPFPGMYTDVSFFHDWIVEAINAAR